jgi:hypothetical protein
MPKMSMRGYHFRKTCPCPLCDLVKASVALVEAMIAEEKKKAKK